MADQILAWAVVILPTLFALGIEVVSKEIKEHPYWRAGVLIFGVGLSALTWFQMSRANKIAGKDRESAIIETAIETSNRVNTKIKENMYVALQKYNNANPQHQVTSEQFAQLTKGLSNLGEKSHAEKSPLDPPVPLLANLDSYLIAGILDIYGKRMEQEWYTWYDDEDDRLLIRSVDIKQHGGGDTDNGRAALAEMDALRIYFSGRYNANSANGVKEAAPFVAEGVRRLIKLGKATEEDQNLARTFEKSSGGVGLGRYLVALSRRLDSSQVP